MEKWSDKYADRECLYAGIERYWIHEQSWSLDCCLLPRPGPQAGLAFWSTSLRRNAH